MRIKTLALSLLLAVFASGNAAVVSAKQFRVIKLVATGGGSTVATIHVNDQSLLAEFDRSSDSFLFSEEAFFTMNKKDKTYRVQSYAELQAAAGRKALEIAQSPETTDGGHGVELNLTEETGTIAGLRVRKLVKMNRGELEAEFWVSSELMPARLRALGESMRSSLPKDYWRRMGGNPGMVEIIMLFGVPLKMVSKGHKTYHAKVVSRPSSGFSFEVPAAYRRLDN